MSCTCTAVRRMRRSEPRSIRLIDIYRATHGLKTQFATLAEMVREAAQRDGIRR
jgi:hypothetical protein